MTGEAHWHRICPLQVIVPETGVCALLQGRPVAVFRLRDDTLRAIDNHDPFSGVSVLSRGIVGDLEGERVVASPIYKQHFSLATGRCLEDATKSVNAYSVKLMDGDVWLDSRAKRRYLPTPRATQAVESLVVVGNGMAAMRTVEEVLERAPGRYAITVFGAEPGGSYNRIQLSSVLAGERDVADIVTHPAAWYDDNGITLHAGDSVVAIDRGRREVRSAAGITAHYDRLLLATGATPFVPPIKGVDLDGVTAFRTQVDVDRMVAACGATSQAVVIGGGLLGLEAATGLAGRGMDVTVLHRGDYLMERQLDARAATMLKASLAERGVTTRLAANSAELLGDEQNRVRAVRLDDGTELPASLVVVAAGIRPNIDLARDSGLACNNGVLVNDTLQSFDPRIYAVGECVEHRGQCYGLVAPLYEQAGICAAQLAGQPQPGYAGSVSGTQLKVSGVQVYSAGDFSGGDGTEDLVLNDPRRGVYKRLVLREDRLVGAVLFGDAGDGAWYFDLIRSRTPVTEMRSRLLFGPACCEAAA